MGNQSSSAQGSIYIQTDQPFYMAGDTVTGKVFINMIESYPANVLQLKVKGYEECQWEEARTREIKKRGSNGEETTETETYYETQKGKNSFYSHKFPLYIWSGFSYMPAGQFTFPFQFKLLDTLPGTFFEKGVENGSDYKAVIKYKVKAVIEGNNSKQLKNKQDLVIREPLKSFVTSQFGENRVKPSTWCCLSQGESHIKCHFEKNTYIPGETARMLADLDNSQCDLAINQLRCSFEKHLRLTSSKGSQLNIKRTIQSRNFGGVGARQTAIDANRKTAELILNNPKGDPIQPSTHGRLVNCEYSLKMLADLEGVICCSSEPEVTVPISVVSLPPVNYGVVTTPPNWNPQVFEVKSFAFTNEQLYVKAPQVPISLNVNIPPPFVPNIAPPQMNIQMNAPAPNLAPQMNVQMNAQQPNFAPTANIQMGAPIMNVNMNIPPPNMNVQISGDNYHNNNDAQMNVNFGMPGMNMNMNVPAPEMNISLNTNEGNTSNTGLQMNMGFNDDGYNNQMNMGMGMNMNMNMNMNVNGGDGFNNGNHF